MLNWRLYEIQYQLIFCIKTSYPCYWKHLPFDLSTAFVVWTDIMLYLAYGMSAELVISFKFSIIWSGSTTNCPVMLQELRDIAGTDMVKGKHFFLETDIKGPSFKLDNTGKAILTVSWFSVYWLRKSLSCETSYIN